MKNVNPLIQCDPLTDRLDLHVQVGWLRGSFKTVEAAEAMQDLIEDMFSKFKNEVMIRFAEMQNDEAKAMARGKAERVARQLDAYIESGLTEERAWELVKLEVAKDAQDT